MSLGETLYRQRKAMPHLANRSACARILWVTPEHLARIEAGECYPSGDLLEKLVSLLELPSDVSAALWVELAVHQLDPTTGRHVHLRARKGKT